MGLWYAPDQPTLDQLLLEQDDTDPFALDVRRGRLGIGFIWTEPKSTTAFQVRLHPGTYTLSCESEVFRYGALFTVSAP